MNGEFLEDDFTSATLNSVASVNVKSDRFAFDPTSITLLTPSISAGFVEIKAIISSIFNLRFKTVYNALNVASKVTAPN